LRLELAADAIRPDRSAELAIAKFFLDNDHPREAEAILTPLLGIIPRSSETRFYLGAALAREERRDEARQLLLRGLELDPGSPRLTAALGALGASR
jgi:Flp pilus assembly protein TadD